MMIEWEDCEPTIENFWKNVIVCDSCHNLKYGALVLTSYFKFEENIGKTPKDLELDLRKHELDVGLIADDYSKDQDVQRVINNKKATIVKTKHVHKYKKFNLDNIDPDHIGKCYVRFCFRPREYVIKETLEYSSSIEENLEKLENAGDIVSVTSNISKLSSSDMLYEDKEQKLCKSIMEGKKLMKFTNVDFSEMFENYYKQFPNAELAVHGMTQTGGAIMVLVDNNKIVCPISVIISHNQQGEQVFQYVPLQH